LSPYSEGRPHEVSLEISSEETETRLEKLGGQLAELAERALESEVYRLAERTLREQYAFEPSLEEPSLEGPSSGSSPEEPLGKAAKPTDSEETDSKGAIPETKSLKRKSLERKFSGKTGPMMVSAAGPMEAGPTELSRVQPKT
jgi:hypothetical protein